MSVCDPQDLALVRMEFHLVSLGPSLEGFQVFLEYFGICSVADYAVDKTIVSKKADDCSWRQFVRYVVDVDQEQEWA